MHRQADQLVRPRLDRAQVEALERDDRLREQGAQVALAATAEAIAAQEVVAEARFWLFGDPVYAAFEAALRASER